MKLLGDLAVDNYLESGYCCSESVWLAWADYHKTAAEQRNLGSRLSFAFCGGTGAHDLCGALAGGVLALGLEFGRNPDEPRDPRVGEATEALFVAFTEKFGHSACRDLKPSDPAISKATCAEYVRFVAEHLATVTEHINEKYGVPKE